MKAEELDRRLARLVADYADRVRGAVIDQLDDDVVFSPLGAWMLLAAAIAGARGRSHERLQNVVGCGAPRASELLDALVNEPPPALRVALALWTRGDVSSAAMTRWERALPSGVQVEPMPSQQQADEWARRSTLDLIQRFPAQLAELTACLASAVATRVSWEDPFDTVDAEDALGQGSPWAGVVQQMLCINAPLHAAILDTEQAGSVAVLETHSQEGVAVICVSAHPDVDRGRVMGAAQQITAHLAERSPLTGCSLFDLPVGEGHSWVLTERARPAWENGQRFERIGRATLPAWSIHSSIDLLKDERFGAAAASEALCEATGLSGPDGAVQEAIARFDRYGFEAAAITLVARASSGRRPMTEMGTERVAELRFDHPFAAIAVGAQSWSTPTARWTGLPMFEAWVTSAAEPKPERDRPKPAWMLD